MYIRTIVIRSLDKTPLNSSFDLHLLYCLYQAAKSVFEEVTAHSLGSYTWLTLNETRVIPLENWQKEMHFCPYEPARGKWVLTCKKYLDRVRFEKKYLLSNLRPSFVDHFTGCSEKLNFGIVFLGCRTIIWRTHWKNH